MSEGSPGDLTSRRTKNMQMQTFNDCAALGAAGQAGTTESAGAFWSGLLGVKNHAMRLAVMFVRHTVLSVQEVV